MSEAYTPTTNLAPVYVVYTMEPNATPGSGIHHITCDLNEARTIAQGYARDFPGYEIYVAARISIFKAETIVKES